MPSLIHGSHTISCCHFYHSLASLFIFAVWVCVCVHYKFDKLSLDWISPPRAIIMTSLKTVPTAAQRFAYKSFCYCLTCVHLAKTVNFCFFGEQESLTQLWCVYYTVSIQFSGTPQRELRVHQNCSINVLIEWATWGHYSRTTNHIHAACNKQINNLELDLWMRNGAFYLHGSSRAPHDAISGDQSPSSLDEDGQKFCQNNK